MNNEIINLKETQRFSDTFIKYILQDSTTKPFYNQFPSLESIFKQIKETQIAQNTREILSHELEKQYSYIDNVNINVINNIHSLKQPNTFTITTGHQLNLCSGPLFFIYKIISAINISKKLNEKYPKYNFVPVYWMATEDHDLEEIRSFNFFGKKYTWETKQSGATGEMSTEGIQDVLDQLPEKFELLEKAYKHNTISEATRYYVNKLFEKHGLIILDANKRTLKKIFSPVIEQELFERKSKDFVEKTSQKLKNNGLDTLLYPREINLFFIDNGQRERITFDNGKFQINNTSLSYTIDEMKLMVNDTPEKFSPNVILRPVYQEIILPNLCYVGGPSELVYWFQLIDVFKMYKTKFPVLFPRVFALLIRDKMLKKWHNYGFSTKDLFKKMQSLESDYIEKQGIASVSLSKEQITLEEIFNKIQEHASLVDKSLEGWIGSEHKKVNKTINNIEKKINKMEKQKHERELVQIKNMISKLFPQNQLQERQNNFFEYDVNNKELLELLIATLDPLDITKMNIINY